MIGLAEVSRVVGRLHCGCIEQADVVGCGSKKKGDNQRTMFYTHIITAPDERNFL